MKKWAKIAGASRYSVSTDGDVRNDKTGRLLSHTPINGGHVQVGVVSDDGYTVFRRVKYLVAEAFISVPNWPGEKWLIHLNGEQTDCRVANLRWRPRWFAVKYGKQMRMIEHQSARPVRVVDTGEVFPDVWALIKSRGVLLNDVKRSLNHHERVWPTNELYQWV